MCCDIYTAATAMKGATIKGCGSVDGCELPLAHNSSD
jgi:hypothetical protein